MKILAALITVTSLQAMATPDVWTSYSCQQKCGLTPNTSTMVSYMSISKAAALLAMDSQCSAARMSLQGEPECREAHYDYSRDENFQRCRTGLPGGKTCGVSVHGYSSASTSYQRFQETGASFSEAEELALKKCFNEIRPQAQACDVQGYWMR